MRAAEQGVAEEAQLERRVDRQRGHAEEILVPAARRVQHAEALEVQPEVQPDEPPHSSKDGGLLRCEAASDGVQLSFAPAPQHVASASGQEGGDGTEAAAADGDGDGESNDRDGGDTTATVVYCLVEAEGPTKVVTIDTQPLLSPEAAVLDGDVGATERYAFSLTRLGVSLLDHSPRELIFVSAQGVLIERVVSRAPGTTASTARRYRTDRSTWRSSDLPTRSPYT